MGTIAKGEITLSAVNDAYTVSLTPASYTVHADFSGAPTVSPIVTLTITIKRGSKTIPFHVTEILKSSQSIQATFTSGIVTSFQYTITDISRSDLTGWVNFRVVTDDGLNYATTVSFNFSVARESTMLDWIQDWEGSKTKIGGTYIMTPKLFVGSKDDVLDSSVDPPVWKENALTGVYIGPDLLERGGYGAGIYGYLQDNEIFHLNGDGGFIGGWTFTEGGLQSSNGVVTILSAGSIIAKPENSETPYWAMYSDGSAQFANGNVKFFPDGSAEYAGKITSQSGAMGGWTISNSQIRSNGVVLDSDKNIIGCYGQRLLTNNETGDAVISTDPSSGVIMYCSSITDFGIKAKINGNTYFQFGASNVLGGWNFNHQAFWTGSETPYVTQGTYADNSDELTLAPTGIRSQKWYVDANGTAAFVGGNVTFAANYADMFGWMMKTSRFYSTHAVLVSDDSYNGLFLSASDLSDISISSLPSQIHNEGGIYLYSNGAASRLKACDASGNVRLFLTTSGTNTIGNWSFSHEAIYIGNTTTDNTTGFTSNDGSMILATSGLIGHKWKLMADGSGSVANGNISWDSSGNITFADSVSLAWSNISGAMGNKLSQIDSNGIYVGTVKADNITAGTISTASIKSEGKWALNFSGDGYLAQQNINWDASGNVTVKGDLTVKTLTYALDQTVNLVSGGTLLNPSMSDWDGVLPQLPANTARQLIVVWPATTKTVYDMDLSPANSNVNLRFVDDADKYSSIHIVWGCHFQIFGFGTEGGTDWWIVSDNLDDMKLGGTLIS